MLTTILDVCGRGWLIAVVLVALINLAFAIKLVFVNRSVIALVAFGPIAVLPLWLGVIGCMLSITDAIQLGMSGEANSLNTNLLVALALLPLVVGAALCIPAFFVSSFGRFWLATRSVAAKTVSKETASSASNDDLAFQQYSDMVSTTGHRRAR